MRGTVSIAAVLSLLAAVLATPASAERVPIGATPLDIPAEDCGFPIHVGVVEDKEYIVNTREAADGTTTLRLTGKLIVSLTNVDTGTTIVRAVSGPGWATFYPDGSSLFRSQGHTFGFNSPADQQVLGLPGLFFSTGNLVAQFGPDGSGVSASSSGLIEDGCALLAG